MQHLAIFHRESSAETVAGRMEQQRIRTGLTGDHTASGDTIYNLFVSDRQIEDAMRLLADIVQEKMAEDDVLQCPECSSQDVHPAVEDDERDLYFPLEPRFRLMQKSGDPIHLCCRSCGHEWS
tara:strand:- start:3004 stop:3372 length:369 start_codon:yes stop_codon:yes gene_type:complete